MKKNLLTHGIYIVIIVFLAVFANLKANQAEESMEVAQRDHQFAQEQADVAAQRAVEAEREKNRAQIAREEAEKNLARLKECQGKK